MSRIEPSADPIWRVRSMSLAELISEPMTPGKVIKEAKTWLDWASWLTIQVLAYGEGKHFYYKEGCWRKWYSPKSR